jgi:hypothetical protein
VIVNLTTGRALAYVGDVPPGARLWLHPQDDGGVRAQLEGRDVSAALRSIDGVEPGTPWDEATVAAPARAITLVPGRNDLWFLPVATYDAPGLDRVLLALADLLLHEGRFDQTSFDHALFVQSPAVTLRASWVEAQPARVRIELPGGAMVSRAGEIDAALTERTGAELSLRDGVAELVAAGVASELELAPFREQQPQMDFAAGRLPLAHREGGPTGADRMPDSGGLFAVTDFDESTFQ